MSNFRLKFVDPASKWEYVTETEAYMTLDTQLSDTMRQKHHENQFTPKPKTIEITSNVHTIYLPKRSYLMESLDNKILFMNENGLVFKWSAPFSDSFEDVDANIPRKLNISQVLGVVQVWFGLLIIATVSFVSEVIIFHFATIKK